MAHVLYFILVFLGFADLILVSPALWQAVTKLEAGRLMSTLATLAGIVLLAYLRALMTPPTPPMGIVALFLIDIGLTGYAITLPRYGLMGLARSIRRVTRR